MAFLPTNAAQVQQFAVAMYGIKVGSATMTQVQNDIANVGGLNKALNAYYAASFGSSTTSAVAASVAANLGLTGTAATDAAAYITAVLNGTAASARGEAILGVVSLFSTLTDNATFGAAATAWNTKVEAAIAYTGSSDASVAAGSVAEGQVFALTTGVDLATGTSNADVFNGYYNQTAGSTDSTLSATDVINGGAGVDTLNITTAGTPVGFGSSSISGVEIINLRATAATGTLALATAGVSGLTDFNAVGTGAVTVTGLNAGAAYGLTGDGSTQLGAQSATYAATATAATLNVKNGVGPTGTTAPTVAIGGTATTSATINSTGATNKIGTLDLDTNTGGTLITALTVAADKNLTTGAMTAAALKTVTVTGAGVVDLDSGTTALATTVTKVDATGSTGGAKVKLGANTTEFAGGAGADFVSIGTLVFSSTAKLAGGEGTDTLAIADSTATLFTTAAKANISGFEVLEVSSAATKTFNFAALTGLTALNVSTATSAVIDNLGAAIPVTVTGNQTTMLTLNVKDATVPTNMSDSATITLDKAGSATTTSVVTVANITSDGLETLNIVSSGVAGNSSTVTTDNNVVSSLAGLATSNVNQINISGAADLSLTTGAINKTVNIVSTGTGNMTITGAANTSASGITTGAGKDTITGGAARDVISTGAGDDTITGGAGGDTLNGGEGNDAYNFDITADSLVTALTAFDKITVTSGDKFHEAAATLTAGTYTAGTQTTLTIGSAANLLSALTEVSKAATTALTTSAGYLVTITDTGSTYAGTYLVVEDGTTAGTVDAADYVVKLIGVGSSATLTASGTDIALTFA